MDRYHKMCVAAKLSYYRKDPSFEDLKKLSGMTDAEFNENVELYALAANLTNPFRTDKECLSKDETALVMLMSEQRGLVWDNESWITEDEVMTNFKNGKYKSDRS